MLSGIKLFKALVIHLIDIMCTLENPGFIPIQFQEKIFKNLAPISSYTLIHYLRPIYKFMIFGRSKILSDEKKVMEKLGGFSLFGDFWQFRVEIFQIFMKILRKYDCENPNKIGQPRIKIWQKTLFYEIFGHSNEILNSELLEKKSL